MSCAICGKPSLIGARLCSPCRAALKRAKDDTVFELPPGRSAAVRGRHAAVRAIGDPAAAPASRSTPTATIVPAPRARRLRAMGLGLLCAAAFGATGLRLAAQGDERVALVTPAPAAPSVPAERDAPVPLAPAAGIVAVNGTSAPAAVPGGSMAAVPEAGSPAPTQADRPAGHRVYDTLVRAPREPAHAAPKAPPPVEPPPVVAPAPAPAPPPVKVATAAPVAPVRADPWQALDAALAQCASETLFARLGCEHRARARYCEGRWGEPTHCPSGVNVDHGQ
jgi:hypothetical protein